MKFYFDINQEKEMKRIIIPLIVLVMAMMGYAQTEIGVMNFPDGKVQHVVRANEIDWKPCPPNLPSGCGMAILEGYPKKEDLFTVRFIANDKIFMPAHTHPKDERVTIIEGKAAVGFGENVTREEAKEFGPGDYYVNARNAVHKVWIEKGAVLQITGIGPWEVRYVDQKKEKTDRSQFTQTSAELEKRDQVVSEEDFQILKRAKEILSDEAVWDRNDDRNCEKTDQKWSLFCALWKASIEITGEYQHRRVALQEVRFAIEDVSGGKAYKHRLMDFNNTSPFSDIHKVLQIALERVEQIK